MKWWSPPKKNKMCFGTESFTISLAIRTRFFIAVQFGAIQRCALLVSIPKQVENSIIEFWMHARRLKFSHYSQQCAYVNLSIWFCNLLLESVKKNLNEKPINTISATYRCDWVLLFSFFMRLSLVLLEAWRPIYWKMEPTQRCSLLKYENLIRVIIRARLDQTIPTQ